MTRQTIVMILGVIIALSPFFGMPSSWLIRLDVLLGFGIAWFAYTLRTAKENSLPVHPSENIQ